MIFYDVSESSDAIVQKLVIMEEAIKDMNKSRNALGVTHLKDAKRKKEKIQNYITWLN